MTTQKINQSKYTAILILKKNLKKYFLFFFWSNSRQDYEEILELARKLLTMFSTTSIYEKRLLIYEYI